MPVPFCVTNDGSERPGMTSTHIHRAVSADGTEIGGRVQGDGPPLVLVHGSPHDGDIAWGAMLPYLTGRFTCYVLSTRGRGLSGDSGDYSPPRLVEDVEAFVDGIGKPVWLMGWSSGGRLALGAAAHSGSVAGVIIFETGVWSATGEDDLSSWDATMKQMDEAAADGRRVDAAGAFHAWLANDDEIGALETDYLERCAGIVPAMLQEFRQGAIYEGPSPTDPEVLAQVNAPVMLLRGRATLRHTMFISDAPAQLELLEERRFGNGVVYLSYRTQTWWVEAKGSRGLPRT